jgi:hypothetical protein
MPNFFAPNDGQWFPSTPENVTMASEEKLQKQLEWQTQLSINMFTQLLVQQSDLLHEKNSNNPFDVLRHLTLCPLTFPSFYSLV